LAAARQGQSGVSGFDTIDGSVEWHYATTHAITTLTPTPTTPAVAVTPASFGTAAAVTSPYELT
jgi:hypothetical protein